EVYAAREVAGYRDFLRSIHGQPQGGVAARVAEALRPDVVPACSGELDQEDVVAAGARQCGPAEADGTLEFAGQEHVARGVERDAITNVVAGTPELLGPEVLPRRRVLGHEDVAEAGARQVASAEVHGPLEAARDDHVSGSVGGYGHALVVTGAAEPL